MTMNQLFGLGLISAVAVFGFCQCSRRPTTAEEVIDHNTKAMGGRVALEAVQAVEFELHIADPTFAVDGTYFAARPGKMRVNVSAEGEHVFTEAFDGQKGWQWQRKNNAEKPASGCATVARRCGSNSNHNRAAQFRFPHRRWSPIRVRFDRNRSTKRPNP